MNTLSKDGGIYRTLIDEARAAGVCPEGISAVRSGDLGKMHEMYLRIIDWCLEHNFPTLPTLRRVLPELGEDCGIFVGREFHGETLSGRLVYVFHRCKGEVFIAADYDKGVIPMLYFANGCDITLRCDQQENSRFPPRVPLYVFGEDNKITTRDTALMRWIYYAVLGIHFPKNEEVKS